MANEIEDDVYPEDENNSIIKFYSDYVIIFSEFYKNRFQGPALFITAIVGTTTIAISYTQMFKYLGIVSLFLMFAAIFSDLYNHQRVIISGKILSDIEYHVLGKSSFDYGLMTKVLDNRNQSHFLSKTYGRYIGVYWVLCTFSSFMILCKAVIEHETIYLQYLLCTLTYLFQIFFILCLIKLWNIEKTTFDTFPFNTVPHKNHNYEMLLILVLSTSILVLILGYCFDFIDYILEGLCKLMDLLIATEVEL